MATPEFSGTHRLSEFYYDNINDYELGFITHGHPPQFVAYLLLWPQKYFKISMFSWQWMYTNNGRWLFFESLSSKPLPKSSKAMIFSEVWGPQLQWGHLRKKFNDKITSYFDLYRTRSGIMAVKTWDRDTVDFKGCFHQKQYTLETLLSNSSKATASRLPQ